jgi:hypothetical protein
LGGRGRQISKFEASLVYKVNARTARAIQRNPVLKKIKKKKKKPINICEEGLQINRRESGTADPVFL